MKEKNRIMIKFFSILMVAMMLIPVFSQTALAWSDSDFDYMENLLARGAFMKAGGDFLQPDANFRIETSDGQVIETEATTRIEADVLSAWEALGKPMGQNTVPTGHQLNMVESHITVPVGTKLKITDISQPSRPGAKIVSRDWQYFKTDHGVYQSGSPHYNFWISHAEENLKKSSVVWEADRKGWMYIFLSVADDYSPYGNSYDFENWSSTGNYRTLGRAYNNWVLGESLPSNGEFGRNKDWYFKMIKIRVADRSEMILREMELIDPETGKVLESFKRNLDPVDPFNKQTIVATHNNIKGASTLKKGKTYKVKAKYQYIDFSKGSFNISNPANMTPEQSALTTGVVPNTLDVKYAYDVKTGQQGQFDLTQSVTGAGTALKNLEIADFEWDYVVPTDKKAVKIAGIVPKTFSKDKNTSDKDDWGTLYAMIEPANLALNQPIELYDGSGKRTNVPVPGDTHSLIINGEHALGNVPVGLNHSNGNNPSANDRFTIKVSVREGSASGGYLMKNT